MSAVKCSRSLIFVAGLTLGIGRHTYLLCIQYFACLIFVGIGHRQKYLTAKISRSYGIYGATGPSPLVESTDYMII